MTMSIPVNIELLALDLNSCGRCVDTSDNLDQALSIVTDVLRHTGREVRLHRTVVKDADQARALGFVSSPTIRVAGRDIALELRESECGACSDLCACDGGTLCREWVWRGRVYTEAPVGMIVEAVLSSALALDQVGSDAPATSLPENLERFYAGVAAKQSGSEEIAEDCGCDPSCCS